MLKIHNFNEKENLNGWGEVWANDQRVNLHFSRVSAIPYNIWWSGYQRPLDGTETAPFISFEADEAVLIKVKKAAIKGAESLIVRPQSKRVETTVCGDEVLFKLTQYGAYTFEINGHHEALHIFYNPVKDFVAEAQAAGRAVLRYEAGVHENVVVENVSVNGKKVDNYAEYIYWGENDKDTFTENIIFK